MNVSDVFAMPEGRRFRLGLRPQLESWERKDHPSQARLRAFVAHVRELIDPIAKDVQSPLALRLDVGLDQASDPMWARDLDNFLFPIARKLPPQYVSIWGTKGRAQDSFVTVGPAHSVAPPAWPTHHVPRCLASEKAWKRAVQGAVSDAALIAPGPVAVQVSLTVGARRNWTALWKRTIDGLDTLLGRTYPDRDWNPQDGRIVRLGLHLRRDQGFGHDVEATIWARPARPDWPELRWLTSMDETERAAYDAAHYATVRRAAASRTRSVVAPTTARAGRAHSAQRARPTARLPVGVAELTTEQAFDDALAAGSMMLKTDTAGPPKIHTRPEQCHGLTKENFRASVITGGGKNSRYFTVAGPGVVKQQWPRVTVCGICKRLDPVSAGVVETAISDP